MLPHLLAMNQVSANTRSGRMGGESSLTWLGALALIPLAFACISSPGCESEEERAEKAKREKEHLEAVARLEARESQLDESEQSLKKWESALRTRQDLLKTQEDLLESQKKSIEEQLLLLEKRQAELFDAEAAAKRGPAPQTHAKRAIVIDAETGKVLFEKNANEICAVASTQKLLTGLLVAETGDLDTLVTVDKSDTEVEPTKLYIKPGEQITRRTILTGLLVRSGNDLALCLARDNAGSVEAFAKKMNQRATELGMKTSHFVNPHGLTEEGQQSTAHDMAKLARAAYHNDVISEIVCQKTFVFEHGDGTKKPLTNTNRVLRTFEPCNGMKTGYTNASGKCLVCSGEHGDLARIVVVLGSSGSYCAKDAQALLEWSLKG